MFLTPPSALRLIARRAWLRALRLVQTHKRGSTMVTETRPLTRSAKRLLGIARCRIHLGYTPRHHRRPFVQRPINRVDESIFDPHSTGIDPKYREQRTGRGSIFEAKMPGWNTGRALEVEGTSRWRAAHGARAVGEGRYPEAGSSSTPWAF